MKRLRMILAVALMVVTPATAREFTDTQGRKIEAEIESVRPPNVLLKKDGKSFLFPVAKLSEADKDFVKQWMADNPEITLDYRFDKEKVASEGDSKRRKEKWAYKVTVTNRGLSDIDGLTFDYTIYKQKNDRVAKVKKYISGTEQGNSEATKIEAQRTHEFQTKAIEIQKVSIVTKMETGQKGVYDTSHEKWSESLTGITITASRDGEVVDTKTYGIVEKAEPAG